MNIDFNKLNFEAEVLSENELAEYKDLETSGRSRRTKAEMQRIKDAIIMVLVQENPMTVRQIFYQLTSHSVVVKTEAEYGTVGRLLVGMRLKGEIPFSWIADNTRWMRKPTTYSNLDDYVEAIGSFYRRDLWDNQNSYIEIWLEKDALAGVLVPITRKWDVPLMVTRGYASLSFLHSAAEAIKRINKRTYLYYFGDYDPSGLDIPRAVECRLREFAPDEEIYFERVAVNPEQIIEWDLQTRPTKKGDTRNKGFQGESVEVDAIGGRRMREIAEDCIVRHVDERALAVTTAAENAELLRLNDFVGQFFAEPGP